MKKMFFSDISKVLKKVIMIASCMAGLCGTAFAEDYIYNNGWTPSTPSTISSSDTVTIRSDHNWNSSIIVQASSTITIEAGKTLSFSVSSGTYSIQGTLINNGIILNNYNSGTLELANYSSTSTGSIKNSGNLNLPGLVEIAASSKVYNYSSGVVAFRNGLTNNGTITNEGTLSVTSTFTNAGTITNAGTVTASNGITNTGTITNSSSITVSGAAIDNTSGTITNTGIMELESATSGNAIDSSKGIITGGGSTDIIISSDADWNTDNKSPNNKKILLQNSTTVDTLTATGTDYLFLNGNTLSANEILINGNNGTLNIIGPGNVIVSGRLDPDNAYNTFLNFSNSVVMTVQSNLYGDANNANLHFDITDTDGSSTIYVPASGINVSYGASCIRYYNITPKPYGQPTIYTITPDGNDPNSADGQKIVFWKSVNDNTNGKTVNFKYTIQVINSNATTQESWTFNGGTVTNGTNGQVSIIKNRNTTDVTLKNTTGTCDAGDGIIITIRTPDDTMDLAEIRYVPGEIVWTGKENTVFSNLNNWSDGTGTAPSQEAWQAAAEKIIAGGCSNYPVFDGSANGVNVVAFSNLTIKTNAHMTVTGGTVSISQKLSCEGSGYINFEGGELHIDPNGGAGASTIWEARYPEYSTFKTIRINKDAIFEPQSDVYIKDGLLNNAVTTETGGTYKGTHISTVLTGDSTITGNTDSDKTDLGTLSCTKQGGKTLTINGKVSASTLNLSGTSTTSLLTISGGSGSSITIPSSQATGNYLDITGSVPEILTGRYTIFASAVPNPLPNGWLVGDPSTYIWLGITTDWTQGINWSSGLNPTEDTTVVIPGGCRQYPVLTTALNLGDGKLTIEDNASIDLNGNNLTCNSLEINGLTKLKGTESLSTPGAGLPSIIFGTNAAVEFTANTTFTNGFKTFLTPTGTAINPAVIIGQGIILTLTTDVTFSSLVNNGTLANGTSNTTVNAYSGTNDTISINGGSFINATGLDIEIATLTPGATESTLNGGATGSITVTNAFTGGKLKTENNVSLKGTLASLNVNSGTTTLTDALSISDSLTVASSATLDHQNKMITFTGASSTLSCPNMSFYNLHINDGATLNTSSSFTIANRITTTGSGKISASSPSKITFTESGVTIPGNNTFYDVTISGTTTTFSGANSFNILEVSGTGKTVKFAANQAQTIGTLKSVGTSGSENLLTTDSASQDVDNEETWWILSAASGTPSASNIKYTKLQYAKSVNPVGVDWTSANVTEGVEDSTINWFISTYYWFGKSDTQWDTAANWSLSSTYSAALNAPRKSGKSTEIIIQESPASGILTLDAAISIKDFTVSAGTTVDFADKNVTTKTLTNNGTIKLKGSQNITAPTGATLSFTNGSGSTIQYTGGTAGAENTVSNFFTTTFNNLIVDQYAILALGTNSLTVNGNLTNNGTVHINGTGSISKTDNAHGLFKYSVADSVITNYNDDGTADYYNLEVSENLKTASAEINIANTLTIDSGKTLTAQNTLIASSIVNNGTIAAGSNALTINSSYSGTSDTISVNGGSITNSGAAATIGTLSAGTTNSTLAGGAGITVTNALTGNGKLSTTGKVSLCGTLDSLTVSDGTTTLTNALSAGTIKLAATTATLDAAGNNISNIKDWDNTAGGTFTHGDNTVTFGNATVRGTTSFSSATFTDNVEFTNGNSFVNFSCTTGGKTITFKDGTESDITGTLTLTGANNNLISLVSKTPGSQWSFKPTGTVSISYVSVKDSKNTSGVTITANNSTDQGNNTNWNFPGQEYTWISSTTAATNTNWNEASNWSPASIPGTGGYVIIGTVDTSTNAYPVLTTAVTANKVTVNSGAILDLGNSATTPILTCTDFTLNGKLRFGGASRLSSSGTKTLGTNHSLEFYGATTLSATDITYFGDTSSTLPNVIITSTGDLTLGATVSITNLTNNGTINAADYKLSLATYSGTSDTLKASSTGEIYYQGTTDSIFGTLELAGGKLTNNTSKLLTINTISQTAASELAGGTGGITVTTGFTTGSYTTTGNITLQGTLTALTISSGSVNLGGNLTINTVTNNGTIDAKNKTLTINTSYSGTSDTLAVNGGNITNSGAAATIGTLSAGTTNSTLAGGAGITVTNALTGTGKLSTTGTVSLCGALDSLTVTSGTTTLSAASNITTVSATGTLSLSGKLTAGSITIAATTGNIAAGANEIEVSGNWTNNRGSGGLSTTGTVTFNPTTTSNISGNTTFYTLNCENAGGKTLSFADTTTITVNNSLSLTGSSKDSKLTLKSPENTTWILNTTSATVSLKWLSVENSTATVALTSLESADNGNNINWNFPGQEYTWTPENNATETTRTQWSNRLNWTPKSIPGQGSKITIGNDKSVYPKLSAAVNVQKTESTQEDNTVTIEDAASLDLNNQSFSCDILNLKGTLKIQASEIPTATTKNFTDGYTLNYYAAGTFNSTAATFVSGDVKPDVILSGTTLSVTADMDADNFTTNGTTTLAANLSANNVTNNATIGIEANTLTINTKYSGSSDTITVNGGTFKNASATNDTTIGTLTLTSESTVWGTNKAVIVSPTSGDLKTKGSVKISGTLTNLTIEDGTTTIIGTTQIGTYSDVNSSSKLSITKPTTIVNDAVIKSSTEISDSLIANNNLELTGPVTLTGNAIFKNPTSTGQIIFNNKVTGDYKLTLDSQKSITLKNTEVKEIDFKDSAAATPSASATIIILNDATVKTTNKLTFPFNTTLSGTTGSSITAPQVIFPAYATDITLDLATLPLTINAYTLFNAALTGTGELTVTKDLILKDSESNGISFGAPVTVTQNLVVYNGNFQVSADLKINNDLILLGAAYDEKDSATSLDNIYYYYYKDDVTYPRGIHPDKGNFTPASGKLPDDTAAPVIPVAAPSATKHTFSASLQTSGSPTITVGKNFFANGITATGDSPWNLKLKSNKNSTENFAVAYNCDFTASPCNVGCIDSTAAADAVGIAAENCTVQTGYESGWDLEDFEIAEAYTVHDDYVYVKFNRPVSNLANILSENNNGTSAHNIQRITHSNGSYNAVYKEVSYSTISAAELPAEETIATTELSATAVSSSIYLKATLDDTWNTDATGYNKGLETSTDTHGRTKEVIPYLDIQRNQADSNGTIIYNYFVTDLYGKRLVNYHSQTVDYSTPNNTKGATFTNVLDKCSPVMVSVKTGQELHTIYNASTGESSQHSYDSHNFIEFTYSEAVDFGSPVAAECDVYIPALDSNTANVVENIRVTRSFGALSGDITAEGELQFAGLGNIENGLIYTGNHGSTDATVNALYRDKVNSLRLSIAGYTDSTVADKNGNSFKNWIGYIEKAVTPTGAYSLATNSTLNPLVKDQAGNMQKTASVPISVKQEIDDYADTSSPEKDVYGMWDVSSPVFALTRLRPSTPWGNREFAEAVGTGSGSTLDKIEFHLFDNTPAYNTANDEAVWFSQKGWCFEPAAHTDEPVLYDITYTYCADIIGGARQYGTTVENRTTGGIRFSTKAENPKAFKYAVGKSTNPTSSFVENISGVYPTVTSSIFTGSSSPRRAADDPDGLYLGLGLPELNLPVETTFTVSYDDETGYLTDLAGNRLRTDTISTIDRTPPTIDLSLSPINQDEIFVIFVKELITDSSRLMYFDENGNNIKITETFESILPYCFDIISIGEDGKPLASDIQIDRQTPAKVQIYSNSDSEDSLSSSNFTFVTLKLTRNLTLKDIQTLHLRLTYPEQYSETSLDPVTSIKNARVTLLQDAIGNYVQMYTAHALSDFLIGGIAPMYAYDSSMTYEDQPVMDGLYEEGSWAVHDWEEDQQNYGTLPAKHPIAIAASLDDGTSEKQNLPASARIFLSDSPDAQAVATQYNFDFNKQLRVWLPDVTDGLFPGFALSNNTNYTQADSHQISNNLADGLIFDITENITSTWESGAQISFLFGLTNADGSPLRIYNSPYFNVSSSTYDFSRSSALPLYALRLHDPADILSLDLWSFKVRSITNQRGGVTILNNVIDAGKGEKTVVKVNNPSDGKINVMVMTLDGNIVKYLAHGHTNAGEHYYSWDGKNRNGHTVARGMYFIRVVGNGFDETRKVMVVK